MDNLFDSNEDNDMPSTSTSTSKPKTKVPDDDVPMETEQDTMFTYSDEDEDDEEVYIPVVKQQLTVHKKDIEPLAKKNFDIYNYLKLKNVDIKSVEDAYRTKISAMWKPTLIAAIKEHANSTGIINPHVYCYKRFIEMLIIKYGRR